jgi:AcrR family transcriptional regulator
MAPPTTHTETTDQTGTVTRDDVLDAAMALLRAGGAGALSMRRLAARLGVSTQVVYSRVGGKPEVARALHDRAFADLQAAIDGRREERGTRTHVHEVAQHYFDHAVADPIRFELMFGTPVKEFVRDGAAQEVEIACFRATWIAAVRAWLDATRPQREGPTAVRLAYRLWTAVHGITTVHLAGHSTPDDDPEAEVHAMVDLLLDASSSTG